MNNDLAQVCSLQEGRFCIVTAPCARLTAAVMQTLQDERRTVLYVSGNYPPVLTALDRKNSCFSVRRALTAYQYLTILSEAGESCIIVEHDRSVYDDAPETAEAVGRLCRERAEDAAVLLIARRWDAYLEAMSPTAHTVMVIPDDRTKRRNQTWPGAVHENRAHRGTAHSGTKKSATGACSTQRQLWDREWQ